MLDFKNITFQFKDEATPIFHNLSFHVNKGDFISIIGKSGIGKSTVFRLINGLLQPQEGTVLFQGQPVGQLSQYSGFMPQKDLLFPWRTVGENLMLPMELQKKKLPKKERLNKAKEMLWEVGLEDCFHKYPKDLSGGMRQRVSFVRTLLTGCELLLLDEPFSALDALTKMELQEWLFGQCRHFQKTVLFITHDVEEALFLSNRIFLLKGTPTATLDEYLVPNPVLEDHSHLKIHSILDTPELQELKEELLQQLRKEDPN